MGATQSYLALALGLAWLPACAERALVAESVAEDAAPLAWKESPDLAEGRCSHAAAALAPGRILLCGGIARDPGSEPSEPVVVRRASCELFSAEGGGSLGPGPSLTVPRSSFTLSELGENAAIAIGGSDGSNLTDVRRLTVDETSELPPLLNARHLHQTVVLPSGAVLVTGGTGTRASAGTLSVVQDELMRQPAPGATWEGLPGVRRQMHTATLLASGKRVLVVGGTITAAGSTADEPTWRIFDIETETWLPEHELPGGPRSGHTATLLGAEVIVAGGRRQAGTATESHEYLDSVLRFTELDAPPFGAWFEDVLPLGHKRAHHTASVLHGRVVVIGGYNTESVLTDVLLDSVEVYDPVEKAWFPVEPMQVARYSHTASVLDEGRVLIAGGCVGGVDDTPSTEIFEPLPQGESCERAPLACATGHCVDGVCCDASCAGSCRSCTGGTCELLTGDAAPGRPPCAAGYACEAGECLERCSRDDHCQADHYCSDDATCEPKRELGEECADARECSGDAPCVDGVCCERLCAECEACEVGNGACAPFVGEPRVRSNPDECEPAGGECGKQCDGVRATCRFPGRTVACGTNACDGEAAERGVCDGEGACEQSVVRCNGYACNADATACRTSCEEHDDCALGYRCQSGKCALNVATPCEDAAECGSGHCVDGFCCDAGCDRRCEACDVAGREGICSNVTGDPHGDRVCPEAGGECGARCDGTDPDECAFPEGTACGVARCDGTTLLGSGLCDGAGDCATPAPRECAPGACSSGTSCVLTCTADEDCAAGAACSDGTCVFRAACKDARTAVSPERGEQRCEEGYRCVVETSECATECSSSEKHCAQGYSCDSVERRCVRADAAAGDAAADGGCGCRTAPPPSGGRAALLAMCALGLAARARRRRGTSALV